MPYNAADVESLMVYKRQQANERQAARELASPLGTQPVQAVRKLQVEQNRLDAAMDELQDVVVHGQEMQAQINSTQAELNSALKRIPQIPVDSRQEDGLGLSDGGWVTVAVNVLPRPDFDEITNHLRINASAVGVFVPDVATTTATLQGQILIDGILAGPIEPGPPPRAGKYVVRASGSRRYPSPPEEVTVEFQVMSDEPLNFGAEYATRTLLQTTAAWTNV